MAVYDSSTLPRLNNLTDDYNLRSYNLIVESSDMVRKRLSFCLDALIPVIGYWWTGMKFKNTIFLWKYKGRFLCYHKFNNYVYILIYIEIVMRKSIFIYDSQIALLFLTLNKFDNTALL